MSGATATLRLFAAGSLRAVMGCIADEFEAGSGARIERVFGPSGWLRERIEAGDSASVFASADMEHPARLEEQKRGGPVVLFARNKLVALVHEDLDVSSDSLLDVLLDASVRVATSTPGADPSGDYAWAMFRKADGERARAFETLSTKALKLVGNPACERPPHGRSPYAWLLERGRADVFLTYVTNAATARDEMPSLKIVELPDALCVGADYGLLVLDDAPQAAWQLAMCVLSPRGQSILASFGFDAGAVPQDG